MPSSWDVLYATLRDSLATAESAELYADMRHHAPAISGFDDIPALLQYLWRDTDVRGEELDDKDAVYLGLVSRAQVGGGDASWAQALVWLGLWPGLDHVYRQQLAHSHASPDEIVQAISVAFLARVDEIDLRRVRRIASGLVRSTARDARRWLSASTSVRGASEREAQPVAVDDEECVDREPWDSAAFYAAGLAAVGGRSWQAQAVALRYELAHLVGDVGDVVLAIAVFERELTEVAELHETTREAMRKRYARALEQLRADPNLEGGKRTRARAHRADLSKGDL